MFEGLIENNLGDQLVRAVDACQRCPRHEECKRKVVPEFHNPCDVVAIMPRLSEVEEMTGRPFESNRRTWLDRFANEALLDSSEIWQTTTLKCVGSKPSKQDQDTCLDWIKLELDLVEPAVVILFGKEVWSHFFPGEELDWQDIQEKGLQIRRDCSAKKFAGRDCFYLLTQDPLDVLSNEEMTALIQDTKLFAKIFLSARRLLAKK